jgi:hypothetical protein
MSRRACPACEREMLIEDGKGMRIPTEGKIKKLAKRESGPVKFGLLVV